MDESKRPETDAPKLPPAAAWPPPGLERLQGDLWAAGVELLIGGGLLVLPLLTVLARDEPFYSVGPLGDAWWIVVITSLLGLLVLTSAFTNTFRFLRRGATAARGKHAWRTVMETASDNAGDTGFLIQGRREFSELAPPTRSKLQRGRVRAAFWLTLAGFWLPTVFAIGVLMSTRDLLGPTGLVRLTLWPPALLLLGVFLLKTRERMLLRRARRAWYKRGAAEAHHEHEVQEWRDALSQHGALVPRASERPPRSVQIGAWIVIIAALVVAVPSVILVASSSLTPVLGSVAVPRYSQTLRRSAEAEPLRRYVVESDSSITPQAAGEILHVLLHVGSDRELPEGEQPPARSYEPFFDPNAEDDPTGILPDRWPRELLPALSSLDAEAIDYLRDVSSHPALQEFSTLAAAPAVDVAAARWVQPIPEGMTWAAFPIPRLSTLRAASLAKIAAAAVDLEDGEAAEAERHLREVISVGLLLGDGGPTMIDNLVGYFMAVRGADVLEQLYETQGRTEDLEELRWGRHSAEAVARSLRPRVDPSPLAALRTIPDFVTDTTVMRGMRWEFFALLNSAVPCMNLNRIVFGPDEAYAEWLDESRETLVRYPSEEPLFELLRHGYFGRVGEAPPGGFVIRAVKAILGEDDQPGSCAEILQSITVMEVLG